MQNIGLEIKILREQKKVSGKELAERIGLSQSQMSRLEKGQRRIDTKILNRIAQALDVKPSYFFGEEEAEEDDYNLREVDAEIGKIIRKRRHERHLTPEDLAKKVHKTKTYIQEIENGKAELLTSELIQKICKILKLDTSMFFEVQQKAIGNLKKQVIRLSKAHSDETLGKVAVQGETETDIRRGVPVFGTQGKPYPADFSNEGVPVENIDDYVFPGNLDDPKAFAFYCHGDSMQQPQTPSFSPGDVLVFTARKQVENMDFALVRIVGQKPQFRQVFFDPDGRIRLQPLNRNYPPAFLYRDEILQWFKLAAHIARF